MESNFSNFAIEYLCENEKVRETIFVCSYKAQAESVQHKNAKKWNEMKKKKGKFVWSVLNTLEAALIVL